MFVVIFKAKIGKQDKQYNETVAIMRDLAFKQYNCVDFIALTQGEQELALSYWPDESSILKWRTDAQHRVAQELGKEKWYESYTVEVAEIKRQYSA